MKNLQRWCIYNHLSTPKNKINNKIIQKLLFFKKLWPFEWSIQLRDG